MSSLPTPLTDRVLIRPVAQSNVTPSGLEVVREQDPDTMGRVAAIGPECLYVTIGQMVLFPPDCGKVIELDEDRFIMLHEGDLLAVIDEETA